MSGPNCLTGLGASPVAVRGYPPGVAQTFSPGKDPWRGLSPLARGRFSLPVWVFRCFPAGFPGVILGGHEVPAAYRD